MSEHTLAENLQRLINVNNTTRNKFVDRGVALSPNQNLEAIPDIIDEIRPYDPDVDGFVKLIDFDGTVIAEYTPSEFLALTEYPTPPAHEGLTFTRYNWTLQDAQEYVRDYHFQIIGAQYTPTDGKSHFFMTFEHGESPKIGVVLTLTEDSSVNIEWGDESSTLVTPDTGAHTYTTYHTYNSIGSYEIKISAEGEVSNQGNLFSNPNDTGTAEYDDYNIALRKVYMADNIKLVYAGTFSGYNNLTEVVLSSNTPIIGSGFFSNTRVKAVIVPDTCTKIDSSGIGLQTDYCYLSLSKSLAEISYFALSLNTDTVCIPNSEGIECKSNFISNVAAYWYYKHIIIPDTAVLDSTPFSTTTRVKLTYLRLPKTTTNFIQLPSSTFSGCSSLRRINLPEGLKYLMGSCFEGCSALEYIEIPSTVRYVNAKEFKDCTSLKEVKFLDDGSQERITIGSEVFSGCKSLEKVTLPVNNNNILIVFANMFKDCYALKEVYFPESVIDDGNGQTSLFQNCRALKKVKIPSGIITVGSYCFDGCVSLEEVELPDNIPSILSYAFQNCYSLKRINSSVDGVANLPASLERIYEYAFSNCKSLSKVNLSKTLISLGNYAFYNSGLTEIDYSKSQLATGAYSSTNISEITLGAFPKEFVKSCSKLRKVTVESGYSPTSIEEACFQSSGILSLEIPASVTSLKASALAYCYSLQSLKFLGSTPPTAVSSTFSGLPTSCKIYVPQGRLSAYTSKANYPSKSRYTYIEY